MSTNIFSTDNKKEKEEIEFKEKVDTHSKALLDVIQRQKDIESTLDLTNEKLEMLDHNTIKSIKELKNEIKNLRTDLMELKSDIVEIKSFNSKVLKQMRLVANKDEVAKLEKYIDLWNPMNFVTRDELKNEHQKFKNELTKEIKKIIKE